MKAIGGEMGKQEPEDVEEDGHSSKESSYGKALMVLKVVTTCSGTTNIFLFCLQSPISGVIVEI